MKAEQMLLLAAIFAICVPYGKLLSNFWLYVCHCHFNSNSMCLFRSLFYRFKECGPLVYGHFGPKTLRTQDISALVPKCLVDTSAPAKKFETLRHWCRSVHETGAEVSTRHFGTSAEMSWTLRHCISGAEVS